MEEKTKEKIEKRLEILPKHHIDTSIFLESEKTEEGRICFKYLQKVGYNYNGRISFPSLSEIFSIIIQLNNYNERQTMLETIIKILKDRKINLYCPENLEDIVIEIKRIDNRIDQLDRQILGCAIEDETSTLVTLDRKLLNNEKLETFFGINIKHPKDLL